MLLDAHPHVREATLLLLEAAEHKRILWLELARVRLLDLYFDTHVRAQLVVTILDAHEETFLDFLGALLDWLVLRSLFLLLAIFTFFLLLLDFRVVAL